MVRDFIIDGECLVKVKGGLHMSGFPIGVRSELGLATDEIRVIPHFRYQGVPCDDFGKEVFPEQLWALASLDIHMTLIHWDPVVLEACLMEAMGGGFSRASTPYPTGLPFTAITRFNPLGAGTATQGSVILGTAGVSPDSQNFSSGGNPSVGVFMTQAAAIPLDVVPTTSLIAAAGAFAPGGMPLGNGLPVFSSGNHYISVGIYSPHLGIPYRFRSCIMRPTEAIELKKGTKASELKLVWSCVPYVPLQQLYWTAGMAVPGQEPLPYQDIANLSGTDFDPRNVRRIFDQTSGVLGFVPTGAIPGSVNAGAVLAPTQEMLSSGVILWDHQYDF